MEALGETRQAAKPLEGTMLSLIKCIICRVRGHNEVEMHRNTSGYQSLCLRCGETAFNFDPPIYIAPGETKPVSFRLEL